MAARIRLYESRGSIGDVSQAPMVADTRGIEAAEGFAAQEREASNNLLVEYDETRTQEAFNTFNESARNKYNKLNEKVGFDAIGENSVMKDYQDWYDKEHSEIADTLDNTDQQKAFKSMADSKMNQDLDRLSTKEAVELKKYKVAVHESNLTDVHGDLMLYFGSDEASDIGELRIRESFKKAFKGIDYQKALEKELADYRARRIQLLADNDQLSNAFSIIGQKETKKLLKGAYLPLKKQLERTSLVEESQIAADEIMSTPGLTPEQQDEKAKKYKGELRDLVQSRVQAEQVTREKYKKERKKQSREFHLGQAINLFQDGKSKTEFLDYVEKSVNDPVTEKELISYGNAIYQRDPNAFDPVKYNDLWREIDSKNQAGEPFSDNEIIIKAVPYMNDNYVQKLIERNRNQGNVGELKRPELETAFKTYTGKTSEERPKGFVAFTDYIQDQLTPGQKPTSVEIYNWAAEWVKSKGETENETFFFDLPETRKEAVQGNDIENWTEIIEGVPRDNVLEVRNTFKQYPKVKRAWRKGRTEVEAVKAYYEKQQRLKK